MTMKFDDDEMIMHDQDGGQHMKCAESMMDDPGIVLDEPGSASAPFQNSFATTHHRLAKSKAMVHHK